MYGIIPHKRCNGRLKIDVLIPCFPYPFGMEWTTMTVSPHSNVNMNDESTIKIFRHRSIATAGGGAKTTNDEKVLEIKIDGFIIASFCA
jgi:hypothetical protein